MRKKPITIFPPVDHSPARRKLFQEEVVDDRGNSQITDRETASETEEEFPNLRK